MFLLGAMHMDSSTSTVTNGIYRGSDGATLTINAICQVTTSKVNCWKPNGSPDLFSSQAIKTKLLANNNNNVYLKFGVRNLLIEASFDPGHKISNEVYQPPLMLSNDGSPQYQMNLGQPNQNSSGNHTYLVYRASSDPLMHFSFSLYRSISSVHYLVPKVGSKMTLDGKTIMITSITETTSKKFNPSPQMLYQSRKTPAQKIWRYTYSISPPQLHNGWTAGFSTYDKFGNLISDVDKNGKPMIPVPGSYPNTYSQYDDSWNSPTMAPGTGAFSSAVDPKYVGRICITLSNQNTVKFKNVRAYPKP